MERSQCFDFKGVFKFSFLCGLNFFKSSIFFNLVYNQQSLNRGYSAFLTNVYSYMMNNL